MERDRNAIISGGNVSTDKKHLHIEIFKKRPCMRESGNHFYVIRDIKKNSRDLRVRESVRQ